MLSEVRITGKLSWTAYWRDFFNFSELLGYLAQRDLSVRYKQTIAGGLWAVMVPLLSVGVLTFVFGHVAKLPAGGIPYPLMVYAAMMPWALFTSGIQSGSMSLLSNAGLVTKLYFPRLILPFSTMGVSLVDWALNLVIFFIMGLFFGQHYTWQLLTLPLWLLLTLWVCVGPMLILASWLVKYRDLRFLIPFIVQFGLFITPVGFSTAVVAPDVMPYFILNPLVGVIEGFRWALLGAGDFPLWPMVSSVAVGGFLLFAGLYLFLKAELTMADDL